MSFYGEDRDEPYDPGPADNPTLDAVPTPVGARGKTLHSVDDDSVGNPPDLDDTGMRQLTLTSAATIKPRPVFWLWTARLALGTLGLLAGREGLGKSTIGYWLAARITRGELPGKFYGTPKAVLVCATEDSWEHTIVPRLMAADADLNLVYRVDVVNVLGVYVGLSMPRDLPALERNALEVGAALLLLDPLMSRLGKLDTHRDAEVRQALEPLVAIADRCNMSILGLIHHNKSGSADPLQLVMASKAFTAVARSVHTVMPDPDDDTDTRRLFGTPKNNLGRGDLPTLSFTIAGHPIDTEEGTAWTARLMWGADHDGSIGDAMRRAAVSDDDKSAIAEAVDWLGDYMMSKGGRVASADAKKAGKAAGHTDPTLRRARVRLSLKVSSEEWPRITFWETPTGDKTPTGGKSLPDDTVASTVASRLRGDDSTDTTDTTRHSRVSRVSQVTSDGVDATVDATADQLPIDDGDQGVSDGVPDTADTGHTPILCSVCKEPLDRVLAADGETTHPTCTPTAGGPR